mmetsp:Transcript_13935/g.30069  ORF Transcript_13935/g.30069 Transcript_13935/m.30069 type:complete len:359 (-) Transcript_13935:143-1219(-)
MHHAACEGLRHALRPLDGLEPGDVDPALGKELGGHAELEDVQGVPFTHLRRCLQPLLPPDSPQGDGGLHGHIRGRRLGGGVDGRVVGPRDGVGRVSDGVEVPLVQTGLRVQGLPAALHGGAVPLVPADELGERFLLRQARQGDLGDYMVHHFRGTQVVGHVDVVLSIGLGAEDHWDPLKELLQVLYLLVPGNVHVKLIAGEHVPQAGEGHELHAPVCSLLPPGWNHLIQQGLEGRQRRRGAAGLQGHRVVPQEQRGLTEHVPSDPLGHRALLGLGVPVLLDGAQAHGVAVHDTQDLTLGMFQDLIPDPLGDLAEGRHAHASGLEADGNGLLRPLKGAHVDHLREAEVGHFCDRCKGLL